MVFVFAADVDKPDKGGDTEMQGQEDEAAQTKFKCHSQVLISQSAYFKALLGFNEAQKSEQEETVHVVKDHSPCVFKAMLEFFYLG